MDIQEEGERSDIVIPNSFCLPLSEAARRLVWFPSMYLSAERQISYQSKEGIL